MNPEELYAKGKEAADRGNFEYAIAMFRDVATMFPDHMNSRLALRMCEEQLFQSRGQGFAAKARAVLKGIGPLLTMTLMSKSPRRTIAACESFLVNWPTCAFALLKLAEALRQMGHLDAAIQVLEYARKRRPQNVTALTRLSDLYESVEQYDKASQCYEQICRVRPSDEDARRKLKDMYSMAHVGRTRLDEGATSMDNVRDPERARELVEEDQLTKSQDRLDREIAELRTQLQANPMDGKALIRLGDLFEQQEKHNLAVECYRKAHELNPRPQLRMRIGDIQLRALRQEEERLSAAAQERPEDSAARVDLESLRRKRAEFEVREFERRARDYPTDLRIAEHLGDAYLLRKGKDDIQQAMLQLQRAVGDPRIKARVKRKLGYCFAQRPATHDLALAQYEEAREATISFDERKRIDYEIGRLCERMGRRGDALTAYRRVYEVDAGYLDVGERVIRLSQEGESNSG